MKKDYKKFYWRVLKWETQIILSRHKPIIIAVTGSAGKTLAKEAIYHLLSKSKVFSNKDVSKTPGNLNTETGVPLSILGFTKAPKGLEWIVILIKGFFRALFSKKLSDIFVLEMAADKLGDIAYLTSFVHPTISVVTSIGKAHTEFFGDIKNVIKEKGKLVSVLSKDEFAVLNYDNINTRQLALKTKARVYFFGEDSKVHLSFSNLVQSLVGSSFKLHDGKTVIPVFLPTFGRQYVLATLSAIACGKILGLESHQTARCFESFEAHSGRGRIVNGAKQSKIIDESYNSNPLSLKLSLENLALIKTNSRKIVALGDMLELGGESAKLHREIGELAGSIGDKFYFVGNFAEDFKKGVMKKNPKKQILIFSDSFSAGKSIKTDLKKSDIILVKGSRKNKMENIINLILK